MEVNGCTTLVFEKIMVSVWMMERWNKGVWWSS